MHIVGEIFTPQLRIAAEEDYPTHFVPKDVGLRLHCIAHIGALIDVGGITGHHQSENNSGGHSGASKAVTERALCGCFAGTASSRQRSRRRPQ